MDILPVVPIIKKAGGIIVNWEGKNDLSKGQIIACANKVLLRKFLKYFSSAYFLLLNQDFSYRKLFWITGFIAFFLSPIADNLTTALTMCSVVLAVGKGNKKF